MLFVKFLLGGRENTAEDEQSRRRCVPKRPLRFVVGAAEEHRELYESFASSLLYEHKRNTVGGALEFLKGSNVCNYVYIIINLAKNKFNAKSTNAATKPLFTCVGAGASTPAAILLRGIKKDTVRVTFEREKEAGTASDANGKVCKSDIMHVRMKPNNFRFRCSSALLQNGKTFSASIVDNN
jgi:hypothetical protein